MEPTNTLSCANFDILKMDGIDDPYINTNKLATIDFEESYFANCVKFINECNAEMTSNKIEFYKALNEATGNYVVLETFSDLFSKIKCIIDKFIKFLNKLIDAFILNMNGLINSEVMIKKYRDIFCKFPEEANFNFSGYEYTFSPDIPLPEAILNSSTQRALNKNSILFDDLIGDENYKLTEESIRDAIDSIDIDKDCDRFRAKVIGKEGEEISISDYPTELFKVYRNGTTETENTYIDKSCVVASLIRFINFSKLKKEVQTQKKNTIKAYNLFKDQVSELVLRNNDLDKTAFLSQLPADSPITNIDTTPGGTKIIANLMAQIDVYTNLKINQIHEFSNIHLLAFGAKLSAIQECYAQDRSILNIALSRMDIPSK